MKNEEIVWFLVPGSWFLVPGSWFFEGIGSKAPGTKDQVFFILNSSFFIRFRRSFRLDATGYVLTHSIIRLRTVAGQETWITSASPDHSVQVECRG